MTDHIGVGGAWKVKASEWIGAGGAWKPIAAEWIGVGGAWKVAYVALSVSTTDVDGGADGFAASGAVTGTGTATTPSGGSGNYTYLWEHISTSSGSTPLIVGGNAAQANPTWGGTVSDGTPSVSVWQVTVTDTTYGVTATDTATVTLTWTNLI